MISTPGLGRYPGEGNGNLLQYSCLGNPMHRGAWQATVHRIAKKSDTTLQLNNSQHASLTSALAIVRCKFPKTYE